MGRRPSGYRRIRWNARHHTRERPVYERTESLFLAMLMHLSFTASLLILNPLGLAGMNLQLYSFALAAVVWAVVVMVRTNESSAEPAAHPKVEVV